MQYRQSCTSKFPNICKVLNETQSSDKFLEENEQNEIMGEFDYHYSFESKLI